MDGAYHIALSRDEAKRLFAARKPDQLKQTIDEFLGMTELREAGSILPLETNWQPIQRAFGGGALEPGGGEFPLNSLFLGGRALPCDEYTVRVIRPDAVPIIAQQLNELSESDWKRLSQSHEFSDQECQTGWMMLQRLQSFFAIAAQRRDAIVFAGTSA